MTTSKSQYPLEALCECPGCMRQWVARVRKIAGTDQYVYHDQQATFCQACIFKGQLRLGNVLKTSKATTKKKLKVLAGQTKLTDSGEVTE